MRLPLLYTFRRCPYAIRARLAIAAAGVTVEEVEVSLRAKPQAMLDLSPKGTVPVLQLLDGRVLEQSVEIMHWALTQTDPSAWLDVPNDEACALLAINDGAFKQALDGYKYPHRFPSQLAADYRQAGEVFLRSLEVRLSAHRQLFGDQPRWIDAAVFPFVRQFAAVDPVWFHAAPYPALREWLQRWLDAPLFEQVMHRPLLRALPPERRERRTIR